MGGGASLFIHAGLKYLLRHDLYHSTSSLLESLLIEFSNCKYIDKKIYLVKCTSRQMVILVISLIT